MNISFHGAAGCVTGSKHLITLDSGEQLLLDCGMFQGMGKETLSLNSSWAIHPNQISCLLLSHAHIDHSGLIPLLVKQGFRGRIICTPATRDLCKVMLLDCARIQEEDVKFINKKYKRLHKPLVNPLYTQKDTELAEQLFETIEYNTPILIHPNVEATFLDAGHILGSASIFLNIKEKGKNHKLLFSGDVGKYKNKINTSPATMPKADVMIMESTYGNRCHVIPKNADSDLLKWIENICVKKKGNLVIPAFSLGRTQELLFELNKLSLSGKLPKQVKYFVDSPLSMQINEIVIDYQNTLNRDVQLTIEKDQDRNPFWFEGLEYIKTVEESKTLRYIRTPFVVISSSGMGDAGRVKHHIANHIQSTQHGILMSGYATESSLCGKLLAGKDKVTIFGLPYEVHAEIGLLPGMSGHGDHTALMQYVASQDPLHLKNIFLVHGEESGFDFLRSSLKEKGYNNVHIPHLNEEIRL